MVFTVTYRGADGAMRECRIEAADRGDCFTQCRARGIAPMHVREGDFVSRRERGGRREGWGKNSRVERADRVEGKGRVVTCVLSVAFVLLIAGGVWWWMRSPGTATLPEPEATKKAGLAKVVKPAKAPVAAPVAVVTNEAPNVKTNGWVMRRGPHGKMTLGPPGPDQTVHHPSTLDGYWPKPIFLTTAENKLGGLLRMKPGARIIANRFLPGEEEAWLRAMKTPIMYEDTDTPEDRQLREDVQALKEEILKQVESGKSIKEVMEAEYERLNEQAAYREKLAQTLYLLKKEGTPEEVEEFLKSVNPMLKEQGMMPLSGSTAPRKGAKAEYFRKKAESEAARE